MFQQGLDGLGSMITLSQVEIENCSDVQLITDTKVDQILKLWLPCYRFGMRRGSVDQLIEAAMLVFLVRLWIPSSFVLGRAQQG